MIALSFEVIVQSSFIPTTFANYVTGIHALTNLLSLGARVRDRVFTRLPPEPTIQKAIIDYRRWAFRDGFLDLRDLPPNLAIQVSTTSSAAGAAASIGKLTTKMHSYAQTYRDFFRVSESELALYHRDGLSYHRSYHGDYHGDLPTIYGIVITSTVVAVFTHDSDQPDREIRHAGNYDFGEKGHDLWNALAIAILIMQVRSFLLTLSERVEPRQEVESEDIDL